MTGPNIELIRAEIARLSLQPGDVVVVKTERILSNEAGNRLRDFISAICGTDRVLILDGGLTLEVVSLQGVVQP